MGISKKLSRASAVTKTFVGTEPYISPEVFNAKPYSYPSDVWALGCVLYEMCTF